MSKKRRKDEVVTEVVTVEEELHNDDPDEKISQSQLIHFIEAYRTSVEVLKSCGIVGSELSEALSKKMKKDQEENPVGFEKSKLFFSQSISERTRKIRARTERLRKARDAIKSNRKADELFKTFFKSQLMEGLRSKSRDELQSLRLCGEYFMTAIENAEMFGANSVNSNDTIIHNALHSMTCSTLEGNSQTNGLSPHSPPIPLTSCSSSCSSSSSSSSSSSYSSSSAFLPSSLLHQLGL
jgi:hypothetical protein